MKFYHFLKIVLAFTTSYVVLWLICYALLSYYMLIQEIFRMCNHSWRFAMA